MQKLFDLRPNERRATLWAALCHFCVLFSWYLVRPLREALGIRDGDEALPYLVVGTVCLAALTNPLIARVLDRRTRDAALRIAYNAVAICMLLFWAGFQLVAHESFVWLGYAFYMTSSVINLLIVSIFWSLSNESFSTDAARRSFGAAAAGGSLGAICGSGVVTLIPTGTENATHLLIPAALLLHFAVIAGMRLLRDAPARPPQQTALPAFHGSAFSGWRDLVRNPFALMIFGYMCFHAVAGTWAYFVQGAVIEATGDHVRKFAYIDLATSVLSLCFQLFVVSNLVKRSGIGWTLSVLPIITILGFLVLAGFQSFTTILIFQTLRRSTSYGFSKPTREMLFSTFTAEQKYKLKNLLDVAGYRVADVIGSFGRMGLAALNVGSVALCFVAAGLGAVWLVYNQLLGRAYKRRVVTEAPQTTDGGH